jgi:hypothetical protein
MPLRLIRRSNTVRPVRPPIIDKLSEPERIFLRDAWREYPGALGFPREKAADVEAVAASLIDQGYIERVEHTADRQARGDELVEFDPEQQVSYRVTDYWAGRLKAVAGRIGWES